MDCSYNTDNSCGWNSLPGLLHKGQENNGESRKTTEFRARFLKNKLEKSLFKRSLLSLTDKHGFTNYPKTDESFLMADMENFMADIVSAEKLPHTQGSLPLEVVVRSSKFPSTTSKHRKGSQASKPGLFQDPLFIMKHQRLLTYSKKMDLFIWLP